MNLFTSNRMEILSRALCDTLTRQPLASPFDREVIVVQSTGMRRWLSMEIARHTGVCAHVRFEFPNVFLTDMLRRAFPDSPPSSSGGMDVMTWAIAGVLADRRPHPELSPLAGYLKDGVELKRYQLAARIADTFDQYTVFRPDMLLRWENGPLPEEKDQRWQAWLWRTLAAGEKAGHRAGLWKSFLGAVESGRLCAADFPARVSVFGISTLPGFHMQVLAALSELIDIRLFVLNPCREYWGDILSGFELKREEARADRLHIDREDRHLEPGNSLLASMGMVARDFFSILSGTEHQERSSFEASP
ncbi:MAG: exodeoxyribonuclease V subunit gamma, partial [Thermodesulfobacteriota bacterium]